MSDEGRARRGDGGARGLPHTLLYPLSAARRDRLPVGPLRLRARPRSRAVDQRRFRRQRAYAYMGLGTVTAFAVFGYVLGRRRSERTRATPLRAHPRLHWPTTDGSRFSRLFQEALTIELSRPARPAAVVLMLDLDDFK